MKDFVEKRMLIVVPPFASIDRPSLGVHTLQSVARTNGIEIAVLYSNLVFASLIGEITYETISTTPTFELLGERIFGSLIHDEIPQPCLQDVNDRISDACRNAAICGQAVLTMEIISEAARLTVENLVNEVVKNSYDRIGFSTTFEQSNATAYLARRLKQAKPDSIVALGGANCEGDMAQAMCALIPEADFVFSGESENDIQRIFQDENAPTHSRIISCSPNEDLESLPENNFGEYFEQLKRWLPDSLAVKNGTLQIPYESSRGCWWGQKHHCTFCGLNGEGIKYRQKSPELVLSQLNALYENTGIARICVADNIMPHSYFKALLPKLAENKYKFDIFYEQKANIDLAKAVLLKSAGVGRIQPGIEALNSDILRLMRKGITAKQNISLLRYARCVDIEVAWNLIHEFPGEKKAWYRDMCTLMDAISHLQPPSGLCRLSIDRFSPYFSSPDDFGITNIRPIPAYAQAFPKHIDLSKLAYHFEADYESRFDAFDWSEIRTSIENWRKHWSGGDIRPILFAGRDTENDYFFVDTRFGLDAKVEYISEEQARHILTGHKTTTEISRWAIENRLTLKIDNELIPLVCASPDLLSKFLEGDGHSLHPAVIPIRSSAKV